MAITTILDRVTTLVLLGAVFYVFLVAKPSSAPAPNDGAAIGKSAPRVSGKPYTAERTLILSLRTTCSFCTDSMPFYRRLVEGRQPAGNSFQIIAVSTEEAEALTQYLGRHDVVVDGVAQIEPGDWGDYLRTPTALIVDAEGLIIGRWTGRLTTTGELEVQRKLGLDESFWQKLIS